jgi:hypothetical protein
MSPSIRVKFRLKWSIRLCHCCSPYRLMNPTIATLWFGLSQLSANARYTLQKAGALPADDWLLIAGWQVWQLPKDKAFICVREGELYLSRRALQQLQVRFVVERDRVVIWSGSYRQAVLLDGKDGFREGKEVWVRLLALQEKGLFAVDEYKVFLEGKQQGVRMFRMLALRPVAAESDKQEER